MNDYGTSLEEHRIMIQRNDPYAYEKELETEEGLQGLRKNLCKHLHDEYEVTPQRDKELLNEYILKIFELQNRKPYFYIDSNDFLPVCWNRKNNNSWALDYIKYEWGHIESVKAHPEKKSNLDNLCLVSGRCNDELQSGLDAQDLCVYGGKLECRIKTMKKNFNDFFNSPEGKQLISKFKERKK